jgi:hypothetical protein
MLMLKIPLLRRGLADRSRPGNCSFAFPPKREKKKVFKIAVFHLFTDRGRDTRGFYIGN